MDKKYKLIILGLGNILFKDEGFGVHFVRQFQKRYRLPENTHIIDGGTLGYSLMNIVCQTEHLLVIDTVKANEKPGSIYRFHPEAIPSRLEYSVSAHEVEFLDLLLKAEMMGDAPQTTIIAVIPEDMHSVEMKLSSTIQDSLLKAEKLVIKEMKNLSIEIKRI